MDDENEILGGLSSLNFEVNCSNWLGKLLKDRLIKEAHIFYSPFTEEKPEYFEPINSIYNVKYHDFDAFNKSIKVSSIHICRSGAWTPPWLDNKFIQSINASGIPYYKMPGKKMGYGEYQFFRSDQLFDGMRSDFGGGMRSSFNLPGSL